MQLQAKQNFPIDIYFLSPLSIWQDGNLSSSMKIFASQTNTYLHAQKPKIVILKVYFCRVSIGTELYIECISIRTSTQ